MPRKARTTISVEEKVSMIRAIENGEKKSHVAKRLGLGQGTVEAIWKSKEKYLRGEVYAKNRKKLRKPTFQDFDRLMHEWVAAQRRVPAPVTEELLRAEAHRLADSLGVKEFTPSEFWLDMLKRRYCSLGSVGAAVNYATKEPPCDPKESMEPPCDSEESMEPPCDTEESIGLASPPAPSHSTHAGDEFDLFFASISLTAKKLSPAAQKHLMCEVLRLVENEQPVEEARGENPPPSGDPLRALSPFPAPIVTPVIKEEIKVEIKEEIRVNIKEEIMEVEIPL